MNLRAFGLLLTLGVASANAAPPAVLGRVGQAKKATGLYASPTTRSKILFRAKASTYLIVRMRPTKAGWTRVLMSNGLDAYVPTAAVALLPYEATAAGGPPVSPTSAAPSGPETATAQIGMEVVGYSVRFQGVPYVWGGTDPLRGVDCSGFILRMFENSRVKLPRTAAEQAKVGRAITRLEELRAGDRLYFWDKERNMIGHAGIYMGDGNFIHASRGRNMVAIDPLSARWRKILVAARR